MDVYNETINVPIAADFRYVHICRWYSGWHLHCGLHARTYTHTRWPGLIVSYLTTVYASYKSNLKRCGVSSVFASTTHRKTNIDNFQNWSRYVLFNAFWPLFTHCSVQNASLRTTTKETPKTPEQNFSLRYCRSSGRRKAFYWYLRPMRLSLPELLMLLLLLLFFLCHHSSQH